MKENTPRYGGVIIEPLSDTDFVAGANSPLVLENRNSTKDWFPFTGTPEMQRMVWGDTNGCVSFTEIHHTLAAQINWMLSVASGRILQTQYPAAYEFLVRRNFIVKDEKGEYANLSERFTVVVSGTDPFRGNSGQKVCQAVRDFGIVPEWACPNEGPKTREEYYTVSELAKQIGLESKQFFNFAWQAIPPREIDKRLVQAPVMIFTAVCSGWNDKNPVPACGDPIQHATGQQAAMRPSGRPIIDQYPPFLKTLAPDYPVPYAFQTVLYPIPKEAATENYVFNRNINPEMKIPGERSTDVMMLQRRLAVPVTGVYDEVTRRKVLNYQLESLSPSLLFEILFVWGRSVGPKTRAALNRSTIGKIFN